MTMTAKTIYSGTTHNVGGANGYTRSADGFLDLQFADPHPAAENFFGAAWSGCFMGALARAAQIKKVALPVQPSVDATIDLLMDGNDFFLRAKLDVTIPGVDREVGQELIELADEICPYSKAVRGNIEVELKLVEPAFA
jgi:Ohr subfamily peroxiredoxin